MADTVKLPAIGEVDKKYVYVGGAIVVTIVAYAYYKRATGEVAPEADAVPDTALDDTQYAPDYVDPTFGGVSSMPTTVNTVDSAVIDTNGEWTTAAVEAMANLGFDGATVASALGKYLARKALTQAEADIITTARGLVGEPPVGGPYTVIYSPGNVPSTPTTPSTYKGPAKRKAGKGATTKAMHTNFEAELLGNYDNVAPAGDLRRIQMLKLQNANPTHGGPANHPVGTINLPATI